MSVIDTALSRLQFHITACTTVTVKLAPDYPVDNAAMLPLSIAHFVSGQGGADDATNVRFLLTANVDVHFPRQSLKQAYQNIDNLAIEYIRRLSNDPTLNGAVDTIIFPVTFQVVPTQWDAIQTHMLSFAVQFKELTTPIT